MHVVLEISQTDATQAVVLSLVAMPASVEHSERGAVNITTAEGEPFTLQITINVSVKPAPASSAPSPASVQLQLAKPNAPSGKAKGKGAPKHDMEKVAKATEDDEPLKKRPKKAGRPDINADSVTQDKTPATSPSSKGSVTPASTSVEEVWANFQRNNPDFMESQDAGSEVVPDEAQPDRSLPSTASCTSMEKGIIDKKRNLDDPDDGNDAE